MDDSLIRQHCDAKGLKVAGVRAEHDVLVVVPESLNGLPGADTLAELADQLSGICQQRYVTIAVGDHDHDAAATEDS